jgi:peptidoglycan/LPS O-acetylase OafA/YrhL
MELIAAVLIAGPLGYFLPTRSRARGLAVYLVVWAVIFPIQTAVVHAENPDDIEPLYFILNALILGAGIGLNTLGARRRERRGITLGRS